MTAFFIGKNRLSWLWAKSPLSFVFSSDFIQELTKSPLKVCFIDLFTYILINLELTCFRADFVWSCTLPPFLLAVYSCDHNAYKNSIFPLRAQQISLVTSQHLGYTLETRTLRTTSFNLLCVFKQPKQVSFFSLYFNAVNIYTWEEVLSKFLWFLKTRII